MALPLNYKRHNGLAWRNFEGKKNVFKLPIIFFYVSAKVTTNTKYLKRRIKKRGKSNSNKLKDRKWIHKNRQCLHLVHFWQLQLRTDCQRLQTRQAGRQKGRNTVMTEDIFTLSNITLSNYHNIHAMVENLITIPQYSTRNIGEAILYSLKRDSSPENTSFLSPIVTSSIHLLPSLQYNGTRSHSACDAQKNILKNSTAISSEILNQFLKDDPQPFCWAVFHMQKEMCTSSWLRG